MFRLVFNIVAAQHREQIVTSRRINSAVLGGTCATIALPGRTGPLYTAVTRA
jgi:hypothetical protein